MTRVLLIDDDPELLEILGEWLTGRGHLVRTARDAAGAVAAVKEFGPDLVLLDGVLRGTSGQEVAQELERHAPVRVVFLSGLPRDELPPDRLVLQKPIDLDELDRVLRNPASAHSAPIPEASHSR
ncbi:MAG TPA: response regulator [Vulgatibacter sp.]|nr:response regulator [Vulgatibacter sp.]